MLPLLQQLVANGQGPNGPLAQALLAQLAMGSTRPGRRGVAAPAGPVGRKRPGANRAAAQALLAQLAAGQAPSGAAVQALTAQLTTRLNNLGVSVPCLVC